MFCFFHSQELSVLGFSSLFTPSRNGRGPPDTFDIVKLVNSTYELLEQQQRNMKLITDLEQKWVIMLILLSICDPLDKRFQHKGDDTGTLF